VKDDRRKVKGLLSDIVIHRFVILKESIWRFANREYQTFHFSPFTFHAFSLLLDSSS
jgi:hypothetical protein